MSNVLRSAAVTLLGALLISALLTPSAAASTAVPGEPGCVRTGFLWSKSDCSARDLYRTVYRTSTSDIAGVRSGVVALNSVYNSKVPGLAENMADVVNLLDAGGSSGTELRHCVKKATLDQVKRYANANRSLAAFQSLVNTGRAVFKKAGSIPSAKAATSYINQVMKSAGSAADAARRIGLDTQARHTLTRYIACMA